VNTASEQLRMSKQTKKKNKKQMTKFTVPVPSGGPEPTY
jgi:hypothetical protein